MRHLFEHVHIGLGVAPEIVELLGAQARRIRGPVESLGALGKRLHCCDLRLERSHVLAILIAGKRSERTREQQHNRAECSAWNPQCARARLALFGGQKIQSEGEARARRSQGGGKRQRGSRAQQFFEGARFNGSLVVRVDAQFRAGEPGRARVIGPFG